MEKNFVYLYQKNGMYHNPVMSFQGPAFALELSAEGKLGLSGIAFSDFEKTGKFVPEEELFPLECEFFIGEKNRTLKADGTRYCYTSDKWYWSAFSKYRIIEAGRFFNKVDIMDMTFGDENYIGRFETAVTPVSFTVKFDGYARKTTVGTLSFSVAFPKCFSIEADGKKAAISCEKGRFFISPFNCSVIKQGNSLVFTGCEKEIKNEFDGIGFTAFTEKEALNGVSVKVCGLDDVTASEPCVDEYGIFNVALTGNESLDFRNAPDRNVYDRVVTEIVNSSDSEKVVPVCFRREGLSFPVVGMSPMWEDESGDVDGTPVQITKDWHIHPDPAECGEWFAIPLDAPRRYLEGKWSHLYSFIKVPARSAVKKTFVCAFENWGKYPASSHAQLSLVGWGGYSVWEQLAVGSHSESICFAMDGTSNIGVIQDVRPLYMRGRHGGFADYGWSDSVGGGEFMYYEDADGKLQDFACVIADFKQQCPVMTDVDYKAVSLDGKISADITINQPSANDILKVYFKIKYVFNEDVEYKRLCLFQVDSDRYLSNVFSKITVGNGEKVRNEFAPEPDYSFESGCYDEKTTRLAGEENDWFFFHGMPEEGTEAYEKLDETGKNLRGGKNSNVLFTVREARGTVNGKPYSLLYGLRQCYSTDRRHPAIEINASKENVIKKGSEVELLIEYFCVPAETKDYYGNCAYIKELSPVLDKPEAAEYISTRSKIECEAIAGEVISLYPLRVVCKDDYAELKVRGGLGQTVVSLEGLSAYSGYEITCNGKVVDNSVHGKDFLQVYRQEDGKFSIAVVTEASDGERTISIHKKK